MRAGHYENRKESVDIMIRSSGKIIEDLVGYGVEFEKDGEAKILAISGVKLIVEKV